MHKIDFSSHFKMSRVLLLQLVITLFIILFTYKWALQVTLVVDQHILLNIIYGLLGFGILLMVHEFIHRMLIIAFSKETKPRLKFKNALLVHSSQAYFSRGQFTVIMMAPFVVISSVLLILIKLFGLSSLIFMFSFHSAYCLIDILLVAITIASKFKYIQKHDEGLYLYHQRPTQME